MRIWPVILDSQPGYLASAEGSLSILLAPIGTGSLAEYLFRRLSPITGNAPAVLAPAASGPAYPGAIRAVCPSARIVAGPEDFGELIGRCELSDAILLIDPRCLTLGDAELANLASEYAVEPRVVHSLVSFEAFEGSKEHVSFDNAGQIRGIQRYYDQNTWGVIAGIGAMIVPVSCGVLGNGLLPRSFAALRQILAGRGVPSRDVPIRGGALDLSSEHGMLAANERLAVQVTAVVKKGSPTGKPALIGGGHAIHPDSRIVGPVVIHAEVIVEAGATILGPAVIGVGARIASGAIVAHATICAGSVVPGGEIVRDEVWHGARAGDATAKERLSPSYDERLARLSMVPHEGAHAPLAHGLARRCQLVLKRGLDVATAAVGLALLGPVLAIAGAAVRLESRGPIFFGDKREGVGGRVFKCWKFRTMFTGAHLAQMNFDALDQTDGPHFKCERDPRVTRVGRVLRALNLDELPQLFNVLVGQMSLVGPRPSPFRENQVCVPWREARLSVRPGITGFWQVCRHDRAAGDFHQWIEYDLLYVQHLSLWLDLKILTATLVTLGGKATHVPASWLVRTATAEGVVLPDRLPSGTDEEVAA
jgi:lipopolysaccharide/colanic/teichoic acid biosynthesis glycosyltransferase/carbonic anhydrase/acetyltransferase-like protein (isoleucine patch superfamily)